MARTERKVSTQDDMEAYLIGAFNDGSKIKKIDVRSYQGGYKIIMKTFDKEEGTNVQETTAA